MIESKTGVVLIGLDEQAGDLASAVQRLGGYASVEMGCLDGGPPTFGEAVERVIASGVGRILVLPTLTACGNGRTQDALAKELAAQRAAHPELEFVNVSSALDTEHYAHLLVHCLRVVEEGEPDAGAVPLSFLSAHQSGTVQQLNGGHEFVSRLAALGFTPGTSVEVVQNFGTGPLIVTIRDTRIALGREEARKVRVRATGSMGGRRGFAPRRGRRWHRGRFE